MSLYEERDEILRQVQTASRAVEHVEEALRGLLPREQSVTQDGAELGEDTMLQELDRDSASLKNGTQWD